MRQYQINGKTVGREVWHEFLLTGNWEIANLSKVNIPKPYIAPTTDNVITPEEARRIRNLYKPPSTETKTNS